MPVTVSAGFSGFHDDMLEVKYDLLEGKARRCEYPETGEAIESTVWISLRKYDS